MKPGPTAIPPEIRILSRVQIGPGCWEYNGHRDLNGYGVIGVGSKTDGTNRTRKAHRVLYEALYGEVDKKLDLDHLCRVKSCVNPSHLEPVTRQENLLRGLTITAANAAKTHCASGHPFTQTNTGHDKQTGARICRTCRAAQQRARRNRNAGG